MHELSQTTAAKTFYYFLTT